MPAWLCGWVWFGLVVFWRVCVVFGCFFLLLSFYFLFSLGQVKVKGVMGDVMICTCLTTQNVILNIFGPFGLGDE